MLLYKDCAVTALIGLIFLGSCVLVRKPVVFYMAQRYGTDGTHDGMAIFDRMWDVYKDLPSAATALGIVGSIAIGRYFAKKGKARGATASAVPLAD